MSDLELSDFRQRGLLVGPCEDEETFLKRVNSLMRKESTISFEKIENLFSCSPDWVEVTLSNKGLMPWQGGCALIEGNTLSLQMRKGKGKIWGLYDREEILSHELVHAARMAFDEKRFEEILAYRTSDSSFRKRFGPLFRTSSESLFCVCALSALAIVNLLYTIPFAMAIAGGALLSYFLIRLKRDQDIFLKTLNTLGSFLGSEKKALAFMLHLTDEEIVHFSKNDIKEYVQKQHSLRWKQINASFFPNGFQSQVHDGT